MAISIPDDHYIKGPAANWLNGATKLAIAGWFGIPTVEAGRSQYFLKHGSNVSGVDKFSLRKETAGKVRWSVTSGGVNTQVDSDSILTAGQMYYIVATWQRNVAAPDGMRLWVDGVEQAASGGSTTSQTTGYDSGDPSSPIFWGAFHETNSVGAVILENVMIWKDTFYPAGNAEEAMLAELYWAGWPRLAGGLIPPPDLQILWDPILSTEFPDVSGNHRGVPPGSIFSTIDTTLGMVGHYEDPAQWGSRSLLAVESGAPVPGPWINFGARLAHPASTVVVTGLTPGVDYELIVVAYNSEGTVGPEPSSPLIAKAGQVTIKHSPKRRFIG